MYQLCVSGASVCVLRGLCVGFMIIATRYTIERVAGADGFKIRNHDAPLCPGCGSLCSGYDTRSRRVIGDDGIKVIYHLRRVRCPACEVLHIEQPDFMRPRKHYTAAVIDNVIKGDVEDCPAEHSTIWRWKNENHPPGLQCLSSGDVVPSKHTAKKGDKP